MGTDPVRHALAFLVRSALMAPTLTLELLCVQVRFYYYTSVSFAMCYRKNFT